MATLQLGKRTCRARLQVHKTVPTPLLSFGHCWALGIIPKKFPRPISHVQYVNRCTELPPNVSTSPAEAKRYFLEEFKDVLVAKEDLRNAPL